MSRALNARRVRSRLSHKDRQVQAERSKVLFLGNPATGQVSLLPFPGSPPRMVDQTEIWQAEEQFRQMLDKALFSKRRAEPNWPKKVWEATQRWRQSSPNSTT
jgi:hypothetical protein